MVFHHCEVAVISIHALRKESDRPVADSAGQGRHFNPRSP